MKLLLISSLLLLSLSSIVALSNPVLAIDVIDPVCSQNSDPAVCDTSNRGDQTSNQNIFVGENGIITNITQALVYLSGAIAVILIIIAGLMFIFSQGNPESTGRARSTILYAIIGVVIAVVGELLVLYVLDKL